MFNLDTEPIIYNVGGRAWDLVPLPPYQLGGSTFDSFPDLFAHVAALRDGDLIDSGRSAQ